MGPEVVVAGAGPAGVAVAVALVHRERLPADRVLVLDRAHFPRSKPCGGGLTGHAMAALRALGLRLRVPDVACLAGDLVFGRHRCAVALPRPVCIVRREELDADLVAQAREIGIEVCEDEGLVAFTVEGGRVIVTTSAGRT